MTTPRHVEEARGIAVNTQRWWNGEVSMYSHLNERNLTYCEHFVESLRYAKMFGMVSLKAVAHAILPCIYTTSSSDFIESCKACDLDNHGHSDGDSDGDNEHATHHAYQGVNIFDRGNCIYDDSDDSRDGCDNRDRCDNRYGDVNSDDNNEALLNPLRLRRRNSANESLRKENE